MTARRLARFPRYTAGALALVLGFVVAPSPVRAADTPQDWLQRMVASSGQVSFRGTLVHMCGGKVDVVSVVHRVEDGRVTERVRSLDIDGREIIRKQDEVMCILPDKQTVMVDAGLAPASHSDPLLSPASSFATVNQTNYRLQMLGREHVAGQATEVIAIRPTDDLRFGYRLWLERETAMPLRYELISETGDAMEQTLFTEIQFDERIARAEVEPTIAMDTFVWQRNDARVASGAGTEDPVPSTRWRVADLPTGFRLKMAETASDESGMEHLVYTDGLAVVSVFIENEAAVAEDERRPGMSPMGAVNAYINMVDGYLVTAVGGVPMRDGRAHGIVRRGRAALIAVGLSRRQYPAPGRAR